MNGDTGAATALRDAQAPEETAARQEWMALLSWATTARLSTLWDGVPDKPGARFLRAPECGLVMTQGRIGGTGSPFNLGEITVTRCSVILDNGTVGHAYQAGRDKAKAEISATLDAMMQDPARRVDLDRTVFQPLRAERARKDAARAAKAAATKVDFFTMVRGED
ncbi:phosphonate C-P lyase system protein PhnG [Rhodospirillaceae bacterium KN72]|uniref:Phosphonate C-P lyase system protein PhnG n=1 Tax=Pacificispira spongiicola TaxID=2729598 RepID=A0A7Y0HF59_9PROT|nr:phosphonate C-P lyase system protein PhnG [Pacificispira spongiicola]NMM44228.1 phosphonate C-P lyase system protein PhnG [Pacificispira spongiicola]